LLISFIAISNLICDEKPKEYKFTNIPGPTKVENIPQTEKITLISNQKPQIITDIVNCNDILNNHFPNEINCTFKEALSNDIINRSFINKKWKILKNRMAIPAKNHKVIFQNIRDKSYAFNVHKNRSLLINLGNLEQQADQYYKHPTVITPYFLVKYKNQEIPTYLPDLTLELLYKWESMWIKANNVTQEYFDEHIFVQNVRFDFLDEKNINKPYTFVIDYYFEVDWAKAKLKDYYVSQTIEHPKQKTRKTRITLIDKIDRVISINSVVEKVFAISDSIYMNLNIGELYHKKIRSQEFYKLSQEERTKIRKQKLKGRLVINFQGNFDHKNNRCIRGRIYLDTGEIEANNQAIVIY